MILNFDGECIITVESSLAHIISVFYIQIILTKCVSVSVHVADGRVRAGAAAPDKHKTYWSTVVHASATASPLVVATNPGTRGSSAQSGTQQLAKF